MERDNINKCKLWDFQKYDNSVEKVTWKYLDYYVKKKYNDKIIVWIKNPNFLFKHLSPYNKNDIFEYERDDYEYGI